MGPQLICFLSHSHVSQYIDLNLYTTLRDDLVWNLEFLFKWYQTDLKGDGYCNK